MNNIQSKIIDNQLYFIFNMGNEEILINFKYLVNRINCIAKLKPDNRRTLIGKDKELYLYVPTSREEFNNIYTNLIYFIRNDYKLKLKGDVLYLDKDTPVRIALVEDKVHLLDSIDKNLYLTFFEEGVLKASFKVEHIEESDEDIGDMKVHKEELKLTQVFEIFYGEEKYELVNNRIVKTTPIIKVKLKYKYVRDVIVTLEEGSIKHYLPFNNSKLELILSDNEFTLRISQINIDNLNTLFK